MNYDYVTNIKENAMYTLQQQIKPMEGRSAWSSPLVP